MKHCIVKTVYRTEHTLDRCVKSIVGQTFTDMEVILVDDGSPDQCPQMCDEWARRDPRVRVLHKANGGLSSARNAGIEAARGELITFVDSDDFVATDTYALVAPMAEESDIVEYPVYYQYGGPAQERRSFGSATYDQGKDYWLQGQAYRHSYACNKLYRRELFAEVRFPEGRVFEDAATLPRLLKKAHRISCCEQGCYYYCQNSEGITATASGQQLAMLLESHLDTMREWVDDAFYMHVLNIQMDVCELAGQEPVMPRRAINPFGNSLDRTMRLKALVLNLLGIKGTCKLNQVLHKTGRRH